MVWVEGEPGIGKSALVAEALAVADQPGWDVGWGGADQLTRLPLRVMRDCLQVRSDSPDPRRAHAANLMHGRLSEGDASANGIEMLLTLADELCAAAPTVLAVDDLQWADEASLAVWHELATSISQLRLLLIGTSRPAPHRPEVQQARTSPLCFRCQVVVRAFLGTGFDGVPVVVLGRRLVPGPGVACPKSWHTGCELAALDAESFPGCPPGPLAGETAAVRASIRRRAKMASLIWRLRQRSASL